MSLFEEIKTGLEQAINGEGKLLLTPEQQRNKKLVERYPFLIPRNVWTGEIVDDYDYTYIRGIGELPQGWEKLFLQMCEDIRQPLIEAGYLNQFMFTQIKEKYNRMECYHCGATEKVYDIINKYSVIASYICTECGKPAEYTTKSYYNGYIASFCSECAGDIPPGCKNPITFKSYYEACYYEKGEIFTKPISFEDEWNRYIKSLGELDND